MYVKAEYCRNAGLGNKLFPWARAVVMSDRFNYQMIDPIWFSPRGAAITRGGIDYSKALHKIWLFDNFKKRENDISFIRSVFLQSKSFHACADIFEAKNFAAENPGSNILFKWNSNHHFSDLDPFRAHIKHALIAITKDKSLAFVKKNTGSDFIGLNIRTGKDFIKEGSSKQGYFLTEIDWFIKALRIIRKKTGNLPALIVSDGGIKELHSILQEPGTRLLQSHNAVEDLLTLTASEVLLGSGNSSFSAWASFLGGMDTYSSPQTTFTHFNIGGSNQSQIIGTL